MQTLLDAFVSAFQLLTSGDPELLAIVGLTLRVTGLALLLALLLGLPVGALLGLLKSGLGTHYLVVGCDQILLTPALLQKLLTEIDTRPAVLGLHNSHFSPLPALIPDTVIGRVEELLQSEKASIRDLLTLTNARIETISESELELLRSVNTPQDLAELDRLQKNNSIDQET